MSDLHLEFADLVLPGGDVLILSGDVCEAKHVTAEYDIHNILNEGNPDTGNYKRSDRYARFFHEECSKYNQVIYVMGNHEHYGFQYHKTYDHLKSVLPANVKLLENEVFEYQGVTFLGATLWTDMNKGDALTLYHMKSMMNDYRQVTMLNETNGAYHRLQPEVTMRDHYRTRDYFKVIMENRRAQGQHTPVVVCTHHAPSKASIKPRYAGDTIMNGAYSSDLSDFILDSPEIKFWTHGHTHDTFDYMVGDTRIVCNPRGYAGYEERSEQFDPNFGFDI
jgi:hypothetical protein